VVWFDVAGRDLDALRQFYSSLFGWRIELHPAAPIPYGLVHTDTEGGIYAPASRCAATSRSPVHGGQPTLG
jgi:predicted enzyme related to lactoylglutathione lyase